MLQRLLKNRIIGDDNILYPKIQTLWKRNEKGIIIPGDYSKSEFRNIKWWHITEKIDGMNIRIVYKNSLDGWKPTLNFFGRTDRAVIPEELIHYLEAVFTIELFEYWFPSAKYICLFGEGYGHKIQKNGQEYTPYQEFILFDTFIDGWWLKQDTVTEIADNFEIPRVPVLGVWSRSKAEDFIDPRVSISKSQFDTFINNINDNIPLSIIAREPKKIEGIICRSQPLMLFRNKTPVQFKLKVKDYQKL